MRRLALFFALAMLVIPSTIIAALFVKPYDVPEFVEIDSSESAFLIPLEGDTTNQATFHSVKFLEEKKIAAKRVQIAHRWNRTGFMPANGKWIATVRVIKVDRRPITREWTKSHGSGTSSKDEAIAAESKDSVNFSIGVSCTAHIPEEMAAAFLYSYPSKSLADMMDMEVRARIHQIIAEQAGTYNLFELPAKKNDVMKAVWDDVIPFFKQKGIEITTLAMLGGLNFDNPEIQRAIDDSAKAAQLKVAADAKRYAVEIEEAMKATQLKLAADARRVAQEIDNKTQLLAIEGKAATAKREIESKMEIERIRTDAEAQLKVRMAEADAEAMKRIADAKAYEAQKASEHGDAYVRLRTLETEAQRWKLWNGQFPSYVMQFGNGPHGSLAPTMFLPPLPAPDGLKTSRVEEKK
ncbi:MAG: hypothetical protein L0Y71_19190 [Gemmataceae bacterium]|nr:hypothetical protein [Gemmataceae bacterium]